MQSGYAVDAESVENESTGKPPTSSSRKDKMENKKPWLKDLTSIGNKTYFGKKSKIQIRGLTPPYKNRNSTSKLNKLVNNNVEDSSEESADNEKCANVVGKKRNCDFDGHRVRIKNCSPSLVSANSDANISAGSAKTKINKKKKVSAKDETSSSSDSEQSDSRENIQKKKTKKNVGKRPVSQTKPSTSTVSVSSGTTGTNDLEVPIGKRKRELSGSVDALSKASTNKKLKLVLEESTEESSDSRWMAVGKGYKCSDPRLKRKSADVDRSSSSETDDKKRKIPVPVKKKSSLVVPELSLRFISSEDESDDTVDDKPIQVKPVNSQKTVDDLLSKYHDAELPMLVRPRRRNSSDSSTRSTNSNASTVAYFHSDVKIEDEAQESSFSIKDPEYLSDTGNDSDVPLGEILKKRSCVVKKEEPNIESDDSQSQLLFSQFPIQEQKEKEETEIKKEKPFSYTQEDDTIFICDSDDDFYSSLSQQNVTVEYNEKVGEEEDNEDQLARYFLEGDDDKDNCDIKVKSDNPEPLLNFDWFSGQDNSAPKSQYNLQTQVKAEDDKYNFDADTQIIVCDSSDDSEVEQFYDAETQIVSKFKEECDVKDEDCESDSDTQNYYDAQTQVQLKSLKHQTGSFNLNQFDDESEFGKPTQAANSSKDSNMHDNLYNEQTQVEPKWKMKNDIRCQLKKESDLDVFDAPTQVDRTNEHSVVKRLSKDGPCTVEHVQTETIKVTKKFSSPEEARKYLKRVRSSDNLLSQDSETQKYEWEKPSLPHKDAAYIKNKNKKSEIDNYDMMTQIDVKKEKKESSKKFNEKNSKYFDPYCAQTQIDNDVEIIDISDDDDDHCYNALTQVESGLSDKVKSKKKDNSYGHKKDINFKSNSYKNSGMVGTGIQKLSENVSVGVPSEVYNAMSQMECNCKTLNNLSDYYSAATQVNDVNDINTTESDEECYAAATQVVDFSEKNATESDEECYSAATQVEPKLKKSDENVYNAQTVSDLQDEIEENDSYDIRYTAQTLVDVVVETENDSDDNCYSAMTQVDAVKKPKQRNESRNVFETMTQVEKLVSDNEENDAYNAQTQVESFCTNSSMGKNYDFEQETEKSSRLKEEEDHFNSDDESSEYFCMLEEDEATEIESNNENRVQNNVSKEKSSDAEESDKSYIVMLDDSSPVEDSQVLSYTSEERKTSRKNRKYVDHTMLKKITSDIKTAIAVSPQKMKSSKEKRDSFKLEKEMFYSKQPDKKSASKQSDKKTISKQSDDSDIHMVNDDKWLSVSKQRKSKDDKPVKGRRSKETDDVDKSLEGKIREAKNRMAQRGMQHSVHTNALKRKRTSDEGVMDVSDVRLPDEKEIIAKGLPLLEFPQNKETDSEKETERRNKVEEKCKNENKSNSKSDNHKHKHKSKESSSHKSDKHSENKKKQDLKEKNSDSKRNKEKESTSKEHSRVSSKSSEKKNSDSQKDRHHSSHKSHRKDSSKSSSESTKQHKSSTKYSSSKHSSSKNTEKRKGGKENNGEAPSSVLKRIPKLSEKEKSEKNNETTTKSPLSLDSQMSGNLMSLLGIQQKLRTQCSQVTSDKSVKLKTETSGTQSPLPDNEDVNSKQKSPEKMIVSISMYKERNIESMDVNIQENMPKSILRRPGTKCKNLRVDFVVPTYSQAAENKRLQNLEKQHQYPKEKWSKDFFPDGDLPALPYQENIPIPQQPLRTTGNLMEKLPLSQQASRAKPVLVTNQVKQPLKQKPPNYSQQNVQPGSTQYRQGQIHVQSSVKNTRPTSGPSQRPLPVPVFHQGSSPTADFPIVDINFFFVKILKWNASWFDEYEKNQVTPPSIEEAFPISHLLESYSCYEDYFQTLFPHLFSETWETCVRGWQDSKGRHKSVDIAFTKAEKPADKMFLYTFTAVTPNHFNNVVSEGDLVIVNMWGINAWEQTSKQKAQYYPQLGYIERIKYHRHSDSVKKILQAFPSLVKEEQSVTELIGLELSIKTRFRQFKMLPDKCSSVKVVTSLVSIIRYYYALSHLWKTTMSTNILSPENLRVFHNHPSVREEEFSDLEEYNLSQKKAICVTSKISLEPPMSNRVVLLQGPPGTGKSHTIIGIIKKIFWKSNSQCRICLCAPSNAAVDELMKRLIVERRKMEEQRKHSGFRLVRIGKPENMHTDVKKYTYNEIVNTNLDEELKNKMKRHINSSVIKEIDTLKARIGQLQHEINEKAVKMMDLERAKLCAEYDKLQKKKSDMEAEIQSQYKNVRLTRQEEDKVKRTVLLRSHIVCGTLNSFGNHFYMNIMAPYVNEVRRSIFHCIIMDEASQATELDTLIPIQYGTTKLIMVGDPEQLPPTVLSQKSSQKSFGQSLFERYYNHFRYSECNPVLLLDTQYRMHPDIAHFPCEFVYDGKLKTDESVMQRCNDYQLKPYILFDMEEGQELATHPGAIINSTEAEFTIELCEFLIERTKLKQEDIGIIAPYQQQKKIIKEGLKIRKLDKIETNTVDSFQGREKEVIILSCTRAKNTSGGIGFLANRKRMNVALTRGKTALYVIGCLSSLKKGDFAWRKLIENAERRNVIRKVNTEDPQHHLVFNSCLTVTARLGRLVKF